jgi:acylphosphatase
MEKCRSVHVSGRVQGVGFRYHTRNKALEMGVKGFVMNLPDGSVYIEAEAEERILEEFILWCRKGPSMARIDTCKVAELDISGYPSFEVRRPLE